MNKIHVLTYIHETGETIDAYATYNDALHAAINHIIDDIKESSDNHMRLTINKEIERKHYEQAFQLWTDYQYNQRTGNYLGIDMITTKKNVQVNTTERTNNG